MHSPAPVPTGKPALLTDDVARAQKGDIEAFERLYRTHAGRIHALCRRLAGNEMQPDDLLQDVFVRAWERLQSFRGESTLESWLHRVAVNVFLVASRTEKRRRAHENIAENADDLLAPDLTSPDVGKRVDIERAIAALPESARIVLVLHDIEGYSHEEIAAMSGIAASTVRVKLHRARRHLLEALNK